MNIEFSVKLLSLIVVVFAALKGIDVMNNLSGKAKNGVGLIVLSLLILGTLELLGLIGFDPSATILKPLFWYMDIINTLLLLGAILMLKSSKK